LVVSIEEDVEGDLEHLLGLGSAFGAAVEAGEHVADGGVRRLDQMGLSLGLGVGFRHAMTLESEAVTGIGVGEDGLDLANRLPGKVVDGDGTSNALVANMVGDDPAAPAAVSGPNYRPAAFFWV
jgi:hypothetical protein